MTSKFEAYQNGLLSAEAFGHQPPDAPAEEQPLDGARNLLPPDMARFYVMVYINGEREKAGLKRIKFAEKDVFLVWFSKTLKNWKALVGTSLPDQNYYEVTHNGDANETYLDFYQKVENVVFSRRELIHDARNRQDSSDVHADAQEQQHRRASRQDL